MISGVLHISPKEIYEMEPKELKFWYERAKSFMEMITPKKK